MSNDATITMPWKLKFQSEHGGTPIILILTRLRRGLSLGGQHELHSKAAASKQIQDLC